MVKKLSKLTSPPRERAFLVGVELFGRKTILSLQDSLNELQQLCSTAGLEVVGMSTQKLDRPNPQTFIGSGKVDEIKALAEETSAQIILFDDELNPRHQRELEEAVGTHIRVLDRTALILDIFAQHAHTSEGYLQVKLAQYEYYLPRLTGRWTHLARQAGGGAGRSGSVGGVGLRGPGETQLEVDRRAIRKEMTHLNDELEKVRKHRENYRLQRKRTHLPLITLVGYTNAGKSTLLNKLAKTDIYAADQLFATLDPTTRRVHLAGNEMALITDTVGFIQKLPTSLITAFRATLEEITESNLLIHVVDISHLNALNQAESVELTLKEIGAGNIPVVTALNKIDQMGNPGVIKKIIKDFDHACAVSALTGDGIEDLLTLIQKVLNEKSRTITVKIPYPQGHLIALFHQFGHINSISHGETHVVISGHIPEGLAPQYSEWVINQRVKGKEAIDDSKVQ